MQKHVSWSWRDYIGKAKEQISKYKNEKVSESNQGDQSLRTYVLLFFNMEVQEIKDSCIYSCITVYLVLSLWIMFVIKVPRYGHAKYEKYKLVIH